MRVLIVAAHSDDEILGPGSTIAKHVLVGDFVSIVIAADCRSARDPKHVPGLLPAANDAAEMLGAQRSVRFLGFPGMSLAGKELELNTAVGNLVEIVLSDVIYTHHWSDVNSDHRAVANAVMVATRPNGNAQKVLCFETPSSTEWAWQQDFKPNYFVDVTGTLEKKLAAMLCYEAELRAEPHPRNLEMLRTRASYWGQAAGVKYAEAFVLAREIVK